MAWTSFDSNHQIWTEIATLLDVIVSAANLTALEQGRLTQIDGLSYWNWGDVNDFCRLLQTCMLRKTGASD